MRRCIVNYGWLIPLRRPTLPERSPFLHVAFEQCISRLFDTSWRFCINLVKEARVDQEPNKLIPVNVADREMPDPWPTTGTQHTRPIYTTTQTHTAKYLRSIGVLDAARGTQYRQDRWLDPKDHESQKPGAMFNGDGMMASRHVSHAR
jgi:hypothetical protein